MASKKIKLVKEFTNAGSTRHMGDPLRFRQVLCNLLSNALKFTPSGGTVSVTIACKPTGEVCVEVSDTGVGIAPEAQAKLFRNYVQADSSISRRFGGTGLGLAISKRLVEAMGGEIGCRSTIGQGSTFWFVVPLSLAAADAMENPADALKLSDYDGASGMTTSAPADTTARGSVAELLKGKRILVVDDNLVNQKVSSAMLRKLGCNVTVAINGQDSLDILQDDHFDAILMDYNMPVLGTSLTIPHAHNAPSLTLCTPSSSLCADGIAATQRIRTEEAEHACRRTPVIGLTASESAEANKGALEAGMDDWLQKPFRRTELADKLSRWVAAGGAGSNT
jgi:CheY-like chemotaxis protein